MLIWGSNLIEKDGKAFIDSSMCIECLQEDPCLQISVFFQICWNYKSGSSFTKDNIWDLGINTLKLEREFNIKAGVSPAHDKLPEYLYEEQNDKV